MINSSSTSTTAKLVGIVKTFTANAVRGWVAGNIEDFPVLIELCVNGEPVLNTWADSASIINTWDQTKSFTLGIRDIWNYVSRGDAISIHASGSPLPIVKYGQYYLVETSGPSTLATLKSEFNEGYVFDRTGRLRLAKNKDTQWQRKT